MFYICLRILIIFIVLVAAVLILKKLKIKLTKKKKAICSLFLVLCLYIIFCFPFEGSFIRFNSLDDAFSYSSFGNQLLSTYNAENSVFIVAGKDKNQLTYYSSTKYGEKFGMLNYKIQTIYYKTKIIDLEGAEMSVSANSLINTETNESLLSVVLLSPNNGKGVNVTMPNGDKIQSFSDDSNKSAYNLKYYLIFEEPVSSNFYIFVNGNKIYFEK